MDARNELNEAKLALNLSTDQELAELLKTNKRNLESWIKRNSIPGKWRMLISHHVHPLARLDLTPNKVEEPTVEYGLPADITNIVEILKEYDTKKRRDVLRFVLGMEDE